MTVAISGSHFFMPFAWNDFGGFCQGINFLEILSNCAENTISLYRSTDWEIGKR